MTLIRYQGTRRDGTATTGLVDTADLVGFTATRYRWGWQKLEAIHEGRVVACVGPARGGRGRTWWAIDLSEEN